MLRLEVEGNAAATAVHVWSVLHVKSRQEKALAEELAAKGIEHFLPLARHVRFHKRRKVQVEIPLFPGYLFLNGSPDDAYFADRTGRVAHVIKVADQRQIEWELQNLRLALSSNGALRPHEYLSRGTRVEVLEGPFRGLQGIVEDSSRLNRLVLQVQMLARAVSLEVDGACVSVVA